MTRLLALVVVAFGLMALLTARDDHDGSGARGARAPDASVVLPDAAVNHQRAAPGPELPLLQHLPLRLGGVAIEVAGLAPDGRTPVLAVDAGAHARAHARSVYERVLAAYGDDGRGYAVRWRGTGRRRALGSHLDARLEAASDFSLAARNWSTRTYARSRRTRMALATPSLRRALAREAPPARADRASVVATVERMRRTGRRIEVWLDVRQEIDGYVRHRVERYAARVERVHGRWLVAAWTVIP